MRPGGPFQVPVSAVPQGNTGAIKYQWLLGALGPLLWIC
jgi:hypothetical protein